MKIIESKETEAKKFFEKVVKMQNNKDIVDYICIPIYEDGSFDTFHTSMRWSQITGFLEMAKFHVLNIWSNE